MNSHKLTCGVTAAPQRTLLSALGYTGEQMFNDGVSCFRIARIYHNKSVTRVDYMGRRLFCSDKIKISYHAEGCHFCHGVVNFPFRF